MFQLKVSRFCRKVHQVYTSSSKGSTAVHQKFISTSFWGGEPDVNATLASFRSNPHSAPRWTAPVSAAYQQQRRRRANRRKGRKRERRQATELRPGRLPLMRKGSHDRRFVLGISSNCFRDLRSSRWLRRPCSSTNPAQSPAGGPSGRSVLTSLRILRNCQRTF